MQQFAFGSILLAFCSIVGVIAYQNTYAQHIRVFDQAHMMSFSSIIFAVFVLGIMSGWVMLGFLRSVFQKMTEVE